MSIGRHAAGGGYGGRVGDPIGVSIGTSNLVAVRVGRAPVSRRAVLTLFGHLPAEVGTPEENGHLPDPDGMVVRGFVERVGDPVPLVVGDGAPHSTGDIQLNDPFIWVFDLQNGQQHAICRHDTSWKVLDGDRQVTHPHPSFSPDGRWVLYTSDAEGMPALWLARVSV